jgi:hypothetical protein
LFVVGWLREGGERDETGRGRGRRESDGRDRETERETI